MGLSFYGINAVQKTLDYSEISCIAKNIYYEARNESTAGQIAVTQVVFNRVKSTRFPSTSCDVIQQGKHVNGFPVLNRCQFSWYCDGRGDIPHNMKAFGKSQKLAKLLFFSKDWLPDLTDGSLWYHADYVSPKWSFTRKKTLTIDTHIFYK